MEVLAGAGVAVVSSIWCENNPLVIQEAFTAQVPVIVSDLRGISEFVKDGAYGLLFECGNASDLARQMRKIIDDPSLRDRLRAGIPPVKTIQEEVGQLVALYDELQGQSRFE
jgi:glycosyltransferase involved in cell wall biosynthesis